MTILQIIIESLLFIIGLYLAFFKSYFQEKGKNLATKEDISEITKQVESIKNDFLFSTQSKISLKTEERNSLVNCYEKISYWLNISYDTYFGGINYETKSKLQEIENKIDDARLQFELANARMELFMNNSKISEKMSELRKKTLSLSHLSLEFILNLEIGFHEIEQSKAEFEEKQIDVLKAVYAKRKELSEELKNSKIELYNRIVPIEGEVQVLIYHHLQSLLQN